MLIGQSFVTLKIHYFISAILMTFLLTNCAKELDIDQLYVPHKNDRIKIVKGRAATNITEQAFKLYEEGRYDQALILFDELLKEKKDNNLEFYRANTLFAMQQYQVALEDFRKIPVESDYYPSALWYQALILLKLNKGNEAEASVELLQTEYPAFKNEEAALLLRYIRN